MAWQLFLIWCIISLYVNRLQIGAPMHYIPLLFLCAKVFSFIYHRELALFLHNFRAIVEARRSTKKVHVVFIDKTTIFFLIYFLIDILFLFYCIWLITGDSWEPGCMAVISFCFGVLWCPGTYCRCLWSKSTGIYLC